MKKLGIINYPEFAKAEESSASSRCLDCILDDMTILELIKKKTSKEIHDCAHAVQSAEPTI